jgi:predicted nucleic acid-binding protein
VVAIVIADASHLIGLARRVSGVSWLKDLFGVVLIPSVVADEVLTGHFPDQEALIQAAIEAGWLRLAVNIGTGPALPDLDEGEAASIRLALSFGPANSTLLLIDERAGRATATEFGLTVAGTAAAIGMARQQGLITSARAVFAKLHASDFRISVPVIETVLKRCGESDLTQ